MILINHSLTKHIADHGEMASSQNDDENAKLRKNIFTEVKSLMHLPPSNPQVQKLARTVMDSANSPYQGNVGLNEVWCYS